MMRRTFSVLLLLGLVLLPALAQDSVEVDPKHYSVVFENDRVRVLRITYGPGEKSVMHRHPDAVAVFLTDQRMRFGLPDGTSQVIETKKGEATWLAATQHNPENIGDAPLELILVELKK